MDEHIELEGIISFITLLKISFIFGLGASIVVLPFMISKYYSGLGVVDAITLIILVPIANAVLVVLYCAAGYWTYLFFARRKYLQMHKISLVKK